MKQLKKDLQAVTKDLKKLTQKTDKIIKQLEKFEKSESKKGPKARKGKGLPEIDLVMAQILRKKIYPTDIILAHIIRNKDGIDRKTLTEMTGFKGRKIGNIVFKLRKEGKIRSERKEGLRGAAYGLGMSRTFYFEA